MCAGKKYCICCTVCLFVFALLTLYTAVFSQPDGLQQLVATYHFSNLQFSTTLLKLTFYQKAQVHCNYQKHFLTSCGLWMTFILHSCVTTRQNYNSWLINSRHQLSLSSYHRALTEMNGCYIYSSVYSHRNFIDT